MLAILATYAFLSLNAGPRWMRDRKAYDLRPWMLVFNGFMFGLYGAGFLVALYFTQWGLNSWSCSDRCDRWEGIHGITAKYLGFMYIWLRLLEFVPTAFDVLRKRENVDTKGQVLHNSYCVMFAFMGLKFYPKGFYFFFPLLDTVFSSVKFAYFVLASAGSGLRFSLWWKQHVNTVHLAQCLGVVAHSAYILMTPNCAGPMFLKAMALVYGAGGVYYHLTNRPANPVSLKSQ